MGSFLNRVTSTWRKWFPKRYTVVSTSISDQDLARPYRHRVQFDLEPSRKGFKTFRGMDGAHWYFPLVGVMYIHHHSGLAVYMSNGTRHEATFLLQGALTIKDNFSTVIFDREVCCYPVLSNGYICSSDEAAYIQNAIRQKVDSYLTNHGFDMTRKDYCVHNGVLIEHQLMRYYTEKFHLDLVELAKSV